LLNSEFIKYGAVNLEDITAIHLNGDFDSVLNLLQGQVTSDCTLVNEKTGQISSLCNEKGFILCNFEIIFDQNKWLIIIEKTLKDVFLKEMSKFLPFYKVSVELITAKIIGFTRKKDQAMLPNEHLILSSDLASLSLLIDGNDEYSNDLDAINFDNWSINRKIMGDHLIQLEETGKYRPHELGQHNTRVSFNKGCFKGQEIIARMEYLGKLKKETRLIIHSNRNEVSEFIIIGQSHLYKETIFSSCLGKIDHFLK
jgi:folate-binding protein YgfZ|tara:strand:+ start:2031 stop:2795 length:765 start_codon:yes stop_codon:yes gene_type:complete